MKLVRGDVASAAAMLAETEQSVRQHNFVQRIPEVTAAQVLVLLRQDDLPAAAELARTHELPMSQARVYIAQDNPSEALAILEQVRQQMEAKGWADERLRVIVLQALALHAYGDRDKALLVLDEALALAESGGFIRLFVDEGRPMARLLSDAVAQGMKPDYINKLLAEFGVAEQPVPVDPAASVGKTRARSSAQVLIEPLNQREIKVLQLIARGLSNREISERLYLALSTVKGHNRIIFDKLQVTNRTEAVARARELGLL